CCLIKAIDYLKTNLHQGRGHVSLASFLVADLRHDTVALAQRLSACGRRQKPQLACAKAEELRDTGQGRITSWSWALSIQVAADGITLNCVAPGRIHDTSPQSSVSDRSDPPPRDRAQCARRALRRAGGDRGGDQVLASARASLRHRHDDPGRWWIAA